MSVADWFTLVKQYVADRKTYGVETNLITNTAPTNAKADYLRAHFAETGAWDLCDVGADARIQDYANRTYYQPDNLHYTAKMNQLIANQLAPIIKRFALEYNRPSGGAYSTRPADWTAQNKNVTVNGLVVTANAAGASVRTASRMKETTASPFVSFKFKTGSLDKGYVAGIGNSTSTTTAPQLLAFYVKSNGTATPYTGSGYESSNDLVQSVAAGDELEIRLTSTGAEWWMKGAKVLGGKAYPGGSWYGVFEAIDSGASFTTATLGATLFEGAAGGTGQAAAEGVSWINDAGTTSNGADLFSSAASASWDVGAHSSRVFGPVASGLIGWTEWQINTAQTYFIGFSTGAHNANYPPIGLYWTNNNLQAWDNGAYTNVLITPEIGSRARVELYTDKVVFLLNGTPFQTVSRAIPALDYYVQASFTITGSTPPARILKVSLGGVNLSGTAGGPIPATESYELVTENAAWTVTNGTANGNSLSASSNGGYAYTTKKFVEYALSAPGLRASIRWNTRVNGGKYVVDLGGYAVYQNGPIISPYTGSPYASSNDGMKPVIEGQEYRIDVYNDRVEWVQGGVVQYTVTKKVALELVPSVGFYDATAFIDNVILSGRGLQV
jgi:hypothetical protein